MLALVRGLPIFAYFEFADYGKYTVRYSPQSPIRQSADVYYLKPASKWVTK
jgi:hypothetical protein